VPSSTDTVRVSRYHISTGFIAQVAMPAEHLDALIGNPHRILCAVGVRKLRLTRRVAALLENRRRFPRHPAHRIGFDPHIGEAERDRLLLRERIAMHHALLGVGHHEFHHGPAGFRS